MKKVSKIRILLNWLREFSKVLTRSFMLGMAERLLSGLKSLKVLMRLVSTECLIIPGLLLILHVQMKIIISIVKRVLVAAIILLIVLIIVLLVLLLLPSSVSVRKSSASGTLRSFVGGLL